MPGAWSDIYRLRAMDFSEMTEPERQRVARLIEVLGRAPPLRRSHRRRRSHRTRQVDLRATLRESRRFAGDPAILSASVSELRPVLINLILDVSASMEPYATMLLHYMRASVVAQRSCEAFLFGTTARRITPELRLGDPTRPLDGLQGTVGDWGGGTRIGAALSQINRDLMRHLGRGGITMVASDGWDRGEPEELAREMRTLRARSRAVIWLSPHSARPGFEPLVRGLQAALPYVDLLLAADSLASLERFSRAVGELGHRPRGPAHRTPGGNDAGAFRGRRLKPSVEADR